MVLILKIPVVYIAWVVWWAIKAEPVTGENGEQILTGVNWAPWRRPDAPRPRRGGPHGSPVRSERRARAAA